MKNYFNIFEHYETPEIAGFSFSEMLVNNDLITFKTITGRNYLVRSAESEAGGKQSVYQSQSNAGIKRFHEAALGKEKNF